MEIENEIKLADIAEIFIEDLHKGMDQFEDDKLIVVLVYNGDEVETRVTFVDDLVLFVVDEIAHFRLAGDDQLIHL